VSETGWPYVQYRGGPPGFLRVIDERTLAWADFRGNRQYVSVGNLGGDDRVSLILMDYANLKRIKLFGRAEMLEVGADEGLAKQLAVSGYRAEVERAVRVHIAGFDWNCPQHITPRFTLDEVEQAVTPLRERVAELEAKLASCERNLE
jgi:predicted pyridoxine 5'-phosphate oxidase superfamily flavin-nucleotide-binding protein